MANIVTVTQTFIDTLENGVKVYNVEASCLGDASSAAIAIPITKLKRIIGIPPFSSISDTQVNAGGLPYIVSTAKSGTTVTVTLNAVVEVATIVFSGMVYGY